MTLWVFDERGLRPATPRLSAASVDELKSLLQHVPQVEVAQGTVTLGDVVAGIAYALAIEPSAPTLVLGGAEPTARLEAPPFLPNERLLTALDEFERFVVPASAGPVIDTLRAARGDRERPAILAAPRLSDAVRLALPHLDAILSAGAVEGVLSALIARALEGPEPTSLGWSGVHHLCVGALRKTDAADSDTALLLAVARDITARHLGHDALIEWPDEAWLAALDRPRRLTILAHVVQSAADADWEEAPRYAQAAKRSLAAPSERGPEDAKLLGAIGRAYASGFAEQEAIEALRAAIAVWERLDRPADASYAWSEVLRVASRSLGAGSSLARELLSRQEAARGRMTDPGRLFVQLAAGRAWAQLGELELATVELGDHAAEWALAPAHAQQARGRWLAWALRSQGDATGTRDAMDSLARGGPSEQRCLAELDEALFHRADLREPLDRLCALPTRGAEAHRWLAHLAPGRSLESVATDGELVREMVEGWRY